MLSTYGFLRDSSWNTKWLSLKLNFNKIEIEFKRIEGKPNTAPLYLTTFAIDISHIFRNLQVSDIILDRRFANFIIFANMNYAFR